MAGRDKGYTYCSATRTVVRQLKFDKFPLCRTSVLVALESKLRTVVRHQILSSFKYMVGTSDHILSIMGTSRFITE